MVRRLLPIFTLFICPEAFGQKEIEDREQVWMAYFNQTRFTNRSGIWLDLHFRMNEVVERKSVSIARLGYTYYLADQLRLTAGYGYITAYSQNPALPHVPENRLWQQVQWFSKGKHVSLMQYFRVEERYLRRVTDGKLSDDTRFNWRFRYNFAMTIPLNSPEVSAGVWFAFLNDELHVNAGKNIVNNYFDQNRVFAGLGYQFTSNLNAQVGYLNVFQQLPAGNRYVNVNSLRLFVFHNLDLRPGRRG